MYIKPFRALLYNREKVKIEDVICPPYDIIDYKLQDTLYEKSPYNAVRLTYGKQLRDDNDTNNRYIRA
ncbi:MAG: DUF1015 family protein, partial [Planctomycetota bacterium]